MSKLTLVFFDAGGGHRAAAQALASVIRSQNRPWEIELLNLQELLDEIATELQQTLRPLVSA